MTPTPTASGVMAPVMDQIQRRRQFRKSSFTAPSYVIAERKKSSSMSSLVLDENDNIFDIGKQEHPRGIRIKSNSAMSPKGSYDEDLIYYAKQRFSVNNHRRKLGNLFDYDRVLREEKKEFRFRLANVPKESGKIEDFMILQKIGCGKFGKVYLAQDFLEKKNYAIKTISKEVILRNNLRPDVEAERDYLYATNSPFVVSLIHHFEDAQRVYFVEEYVSGGDIYEHLKYGGPFSEELTRFYTGQIVLALEYLHNVSLVYRDLKPENVVLDSNGYIKLVDFGFVKRVIQTTGTMVGTPAYLSPEMILNKPYDKSVDWWSLGILIYEMLSGCQITPFAHSNRLEMFNKITSQEVTFPNKFSRTPVRDLIKRLLKINPTVRLGYGPNGAKDLKNHPWFSSLKWDDLFRRTIKPPVKGSPLTGKSGGKHEKVAALKSSLLGGTPKATSNNIQNRLRLEKLLKLY